ncbi:hypothetical protein [Caldifermentibacillus hisashii]|uniref:hypothetical protein n=1 Tax=Caldifermentibacillus hisashii TaxID=996558 RepID=UPI003D201635
MSRIQRDVFLNERTGPFRKNREISRKFHTRFKKIPNTNLVIIDGATGDPTFFT